MNSSDDEVYLTEGERLLDELDAAMHRMGRLMAANHARFQAESGMATPHYMVLKSIACEGPARVSDLATLLGIKNPAASMLIQQLEGEGLLARHHDTRDNRVVIVSLTPAGEARLADVEVYRRELLRRMTADLGTDDLEALRRIIVTIGDTVASRL
jgi:DNA-binding MarR family transcriptional regulator